MKKNFGLALLAVFCLAASAVAQEAPAPRQVSIGFGGKSIITALDNIFRGDIMPKLIPLSTVLPGCSEPIEKIDTEILDMPQGGTGVRDRGVFSQRPNRAYDFRQALGAPHPYLAFIAQRTTASPAFFIAWANVAAGASQMRASG